MVVKVRYGIPVLFDPFHRRFSFTGGQRCIPILMGRGGGGLDTVTMSVLDTNGTAVLILSTK
jgi:hypothetical protein